MITVYKYEIPMYATAYQEFNLSMPFGSKIMKTIEHDGLHYVYAEVETEANPVQRDFCLVWTGSKINTPYRIMPVDTFIKDDLVYHLFEILN